MINNNLLDKYKKTLENRYGTESPFMAEYYQAIRSFKNITAQNDLQRFDIWYQGASSALQYGYMFTPAVCFVTVILVEVISNRTDAMRIISANAALSIGTTHEDIINELNRESNKKASVKSNLAKLNYDRTPVSGCGHAYSSC